MCRNAKQAYHSMLPLLTLGTWCNKNACILVMISIYILLTITFPGIGTHIISSSGDEIVCYPIPGNVMVGRMNIHRYHYKMLF